MNIILIKISELKYAEYNPRAITESQFEKLKNSIKAYGFVEPVVVNSHTGRENVIIGGHMRTRAAEAIGMKEVPCKVIKVCETHEKLLNISLNRISGTWDEQKLVELMVTLNAEEADIRMSGFEDNECVKLIEEQVMNIPQVPDYKVEMTRTHTCPKCEHKWSV